MLNNTARTKCQMNLASCACSPYQKIWAFKLTLGEGWLVEVL